MSTITLSSQIRTFLSCHGYDDHPIVPLAADASARRYYRLPGTGRLLMEDPADPIGFAGFLRLSRHLVKLGLSAPRVYGADIETGLALIEDFGAGTYSACLVDGQDERALYELAVDTLMQLHCDPRGREVEQPDYSLDVLLDELDLFCDWFAPEIAPEGFDAVAFKHAFRTLWAQALDEVSACRDTLVLRDFHVDNLMLLDERSGVARCGILDFQDGVLGPREYDLVSLLQDARRDLAPGLEAAMFQRYIENAPSEFGTAEDVRRRYAILGAQRHARIAGVFMRLDRRDGKPRYRAFLPRVLRQLETALSDGGLTEIAALIDNALPDWRQKGAALAPQA